MPGRTARSSTATRTSRSAKSKAITPDTDARAGEEIAEDGQDSSLRRTICALFYDAQKTLAGHRKLVVSLRKLQETCCYEPASAAGTKTADDEFEETDFNAEFTRCVLRVLPVRKSEGAADRVVKFMTSFLRFATEKDAELLGEVDEDTAVETPTSRLTNEILSVVVPLLQAKDKFVRFRATQVIRHVVSSLESIDDDVYQLLRAGLLKRIRDKEAMVRVQAVMGLTHLLGNEETGAGDEEEEDGPDQGLLEKLLDVLQNDSSSDVRKTLLLNLPLTPMTLPFLLERARDVDAATRRALYSKLLPALGDFRHLSLSMREKLLRWGLKDRDDSVHNATAKLFRERWIEDIAGAQVSEEEAKPGAAAPANIDALLELIERIDIVNSGMEDGIGLPAFKEFWGGRPDYIEAVSFQDPFWDNLTAESIFMVRSFNDFCRQNDSRWGDTLEAKMPEVTKLAFMLERYNNKLIEILRKPDYTDEEIIEPEFIVEQILHITETLDYSDEIGRRKMFSLLREMIAFPELPEEITKLSVGVLRGVCGADAQGERDFCGVVLEAIAEVHDTIADPNTLPEDPDDSFVSARSQQTDDTTMSRSILKPMIRSSEEQAEDEEKAIREIVVNMKCLHIAQCMLENVGGSLQANVHLVTMLNNLVVPAVRSHEAPIRERGLQCLGLCCLLDRQLAEENMTLFLHCFTKGHVGLQVRALETLSDIVAVHPNIIASVMPATPVPGATHASTEDSSESPNLKPLLKAFTKAIRSSSEALVLSTAATCLSKLYLTNILTDDALLQQLVLTFLDPATIENHAARQALSYFLPAFSHSRRENMEAMGRVTPDVVRGLLSLHDDYEEEDDGDREGIVGINTAVAMLAEWTDARRLVVIDNQQLSTGISLLDEPEKKAVVDGNIHLDLAAEALERATTKGADKEYRKALLCLVAKLVVIPESSLDKLEEVKLLVDDVVDAKLASETATKNALVKMQLALYKAVAAKQSETTVNESSRSEDSSALSATGQTSTTSMTSTRSLPIQTKAGQRKGGPRGSESIVQSVEVDGDGDDATNGDDSIALEDGGDDDGTSTVKGDDDDEGGESHLVNGATTEGALEAFSLIEDDGDEDTMMQE